MSSYSGGYYNNESTKLECKCQQERVAEKWIVTL